MTGTGRWAGLPPREFGPPGGLRDRLVGRILMGEKTATTSVEARPHSPAPRAGDRYVVPDSAGEPVGVIEYTHVASCRLADVPLEHCHLDGTPDDTVASWRKAHEGVWSGAGVLTDDDTTIHCVRFTLVERA